MKLETTIIQDANKELEVVNSVSQPIHLSTTFLRNEDGTFSDEYRYSRLDNPNRRELEQNLALLENGEVSYSFSSGMAAISAVFQSLKSGDHIILPDDVFFNVRMLANDIFQQWGLEYSFVDMTNMDEVSKAFQTNTKLIWLESPSNPQLKITDIKEITKLAKFNNALVVADNTWLTPILFKPLELGVDIVMHSSTKYFGGHSDVMGGCLVFNEENELSAKIKHIQMLSGAVPSPFDCWLINRGLKTLPLRVKAQSTTAEKLAKFLEQHPEIEQVNYPRLKSHAQHKVANEQLKNGFGSMLSVLVKGDEQNAKKISNKLKLFKRATSLGGIESLIEHRKSVEGPNSTTPENLLRISVGLEHINDLIKDWEQALGNN